MKDKKMKTRKKNEARSGKLAYRVKLLSDFTEPYSYDKDFDNIIRRKNIDDQTVYDEKTFYDVLDGCLDAPKKKLTSADIHRDFDAPSRKVPEDKVEAIKTYYNGRYDLAKKIYKILGKEDFNKIEADHPFILKFNIPFELNYFTTEEDNGYDKAVSMSEAYIEIEISRSNS